MENPKYNYLEIPTTPQMESDMRVIAVEVLGLEFDENDYDKENPLWWTVEDGVSATGLAVTNGPNNYFIYEKAFRSEPRATWPEIMGLKRVKFGKDGRKASIATQAIRSADEEYSLNRPH